MTDYLTESIHRQLRIKDKKFFIETISQKWIETSYRKWGNCLYLRFCKEDFPNLTYPKLVENTWGHGPPKRFEYTEGDLNSLDWHGGITFYEEIIVADSGRTMVKVGCDYSHYMDDCYMEADCGKSILEIDGKQIAKEFEELVERRNSK
jgi:hypothetical protein